MQTNNAKISRGSQQFSTGLGKSVNTYLILAASVIVNASANILIKLAMRGATISSVGALLGRALLSPAMWAGVALFAAALAGYSYVLSKLDLSIAYPVMTTAGLGIVVLYSALFLHEGFGWYKAGGVALIVLGIWTIFAK